MSITLHDVHKSYDTGAGRKVVAAGISVHLPAGGAVALLGRNGAGKSTLLRLMAGTDWPDRGRVETSGRLSWPIGFAGSFHPDLSGAQNARFVARVHGVDTGGLLQRAEAFAELGAHFHMPVRTYSAGMRARLAFAVAMNMPFDTYLVDEVTSVGDAAFKRRSEALFAHRLRHAGAVIVTHALGLVERLCTSGMVLDRGHLTLHDDVGAAIRHHQALMRKG